MLMEFYGAARDDPRSAAMLRFDPKVYTVRSQIRNDIGLVEIGHVPYTPPLHALTEKG